MSSATRIVRCPKTFRATPLTSSNCGSCRRCWTSEEIAAESVYRKCPCCNKTFKGQEVRENFAPHGNKYSTYCRSCANQKARDRYYAKNPNAIPGNFQRIGSDRTKLNPEKAAEIRRRADNGESQKALAQEFGVSVVAICDIIHNKRWCDPSYQRKPQNRKHKNAKVTLEKYQEIKQLLDQGMTQAAIAQRVGINQAIVWQINAGIYKCKNFVRELEGMK